MLYLIGSSSVDPITVKFFHNFTTASSATTSTQGCQLLGSGWYELLIWDRVVVMLHGKWAVTCNVVMSSSKTIQCRCPNGKKGQHLVVQWRENATAKFFSTNQATDWLKKQATQGGIRRPHKNGVTEITSLFCYFWPHSIIWNLSVFGNSILLHLPHVEKRYEK